MSSIKKVVRQTGGLRTFEYSPEDLERIRNTDTESTKAFKEALREWYANPHRKQTQKPQPQSFMFPPEHNAWNPPKHKRESKSISSPGSAPPPVTPPRTVDGPPVKDAPSPEPEAGRSWTSVVLVVLFVSIVLILSAFLTERYLADTDVPPPAPSDVVVTVQENGTVNESVPIKISYAGYFANTSKNQNSYLELSGFLYWGLEEGKTSGALSFYAVDDYGRRLRLEGVTSELSAYFIKGEKTTGLYHLNGVWKNRYDGPLFIVDNIVPTERQYYAVARTAPVHTTSAAALTVNAELNENTLNWQIKA